MKMMVLDPGVSADLIARRKRLGIDQYDEVWDGVYVMPPIANNDHQDLVGGLTVALFEVLVLPRLGRVHPGANVSDRDDDWEHNYRIPNVVVVLAGGRAVDRGTHWQGGPDFLIEVLSPGDDTPAKLPFYAELGVREVLVVERDTRRPTLYRLGRTRLAPVRPTDLAGTPPSSAAWSPSRSGRSRRSRARGSKSGGRQAARRRGGCTAPEGVMFGYHGRYLRVDVGTGGAEAVPLPEPVLRRFVGGVGLAAWLLHREGPAGVDPLAPESPLAFCFSPLVGTPLTTSAKFAVAAKSPLTGRFNDALSSSHFALHGKQTGFDAIVLAGRCGGPSVLVVDDGRAWLEPAADLWGRTTPDAAARLQTGSAPGSRSGWSARPARTWCGSPRSASTAGTPAGAGSGRCWGRRT
jgi:Uma2 family endonuclease